MPSRIEEILELQTTEVVPDDLREFYRDLRVLITGAGGSIGSEICRQLALAQVGDLVLLGHGENSLVELQKELGTRFPDLQAWAVVADVKDLVRMNALLLDYAPDVVVHAAAHKHVPLMERNPLEAVSNNILGTFRTVTACRDTGVDRFVLISTDKAVEPISWMGLTKRVAEKAVLWAAQEERKKFCIVRFANVAWSRGSVLPIFQRQIELGGPVTVTHPEARRWFVTLAEAGTLVLRAASYCSKPQVFALEVGEPIRILDIAKGMIGDADVEISVTGLRPGERLEEQMWIDRSLVKQTSDDRIWEEPIGELPDMANLVALIEHALRCMQIDVLSGLLREVVPNCRLGGRFHRFGRLE